MLNLFKRLRSIHLINRIVAWCIKTLKAGPLYPKWPLKGNLKFKILDRELTFYSNCDDYLISRYYYKGFDEEINELEVLNEFVKDDNIFFDIGSYNGLFSIAFGKRHSDITVYSFEPNPANFVRTQDNIIKNKLKNVHLFNIGISEKPGSVDFFIPQNESLTTVSSFDSSYLKNHSNSDLKNIKIDTINIDTFCDKNNLSPDIIKIDVEGHEYEVFKGGMNILKRHKPIVLCEIFTKKFNSEDDFQELSPKVYSINKTLNTLEYDIFILGESGLQKVESLNISQTGRNFLFIPKK